MLLETFSFAWDITVIAGAYVHLTNIVFYLYVLLMVGPLSLKAL